MIYKEWLQRWIDKNAKAKKNWEVVKSHLETLKTKIEINDKLFNAKG